MICPRCSATLTIHTRHNVEVDVCPSCHGMWLDKGEMDKVLARLEQSESSQRNAQEQDQEGDGVLDQLGEQFGGEGGNPLLDIIDIFGGFGRN